MQLLAAQALHLEWSCLFVFETALHWRASGGL